MPKELDKIKLKYFKHSHNYYRFILLKEIKERGSILLPIQSQNKEFLDAVSNVHIQTFISEGLIEKNITESEITLILTEAGLQSLRKHYIDYQLDLLALEKNIGDFYTKLMEHITAAKVHVIALYGASDTSRSIIEYLKNKTIETICFIDDDPKKQGTEFLGLPIVSPAGIKELEIDAIIISTVEFQEEIAGKIKALFGNQYRILTLFK